MGSNAAPEKSLQKNLSRKIARFLRPKISPATGVRTKSESDVSADYRPEIVPEEKPLLLL